MKPHEQLPKKTIVATCIFPHYGPFPGLSQRLGQIELIYDAMQVMVEEKYPNRNIDLMLLPEHAVTGGQKGNVQEKSFAFTGEIESFFSSQAQKHQSYVLVPMHYQAEGVVYNSALMLDRSGNLLGDYHKLWPVCQLMNETPEDGIQPGYRAQVFDCDFGKVGVQICYDMTFDDGWKQLADNGAELVAWLTASPQTIRPRLRALENNYWIISSTMRNNASIFQPSTGCIHQQIIQDQASDFQVMVEEIDLSHLSLHWNPDLRNGAAFSDSYADKVGVSYSEREDCGLFWSNDPNMSIGDMAESVDQLKHIQVEERTEQLCNELRQQTIV